mmetsp:Transcript_15647/g.51365  ORF Transcript_15647/g.51365 Transcript_15647/m.51365 type:complete len:201 (+) Transcript_15647:1480-2082(+)
MLRNARRIISRRDARRVGSGRVCVCCDSSRIKASPASASAVESADVDVLEEAFRCERVRWRRVVRFLWEVSRTKEAPGTRLDTDPLTFGRFSRNPLAATRSPPLVFPRTRGPRHATDRVLNETFVVRTPGPVHDHGTNPALAPKSTALAITSVAATRRAVAVACVQVFAFDFSRRRLGSAPSRETVVHEARACRQRGDDT